PPSSKQPVSQPQAPVIPKVRAHTWTVADYRYFERAQVISGTNPRELEDLWRLKRSRTQKDLSFRAELPRPAVHHGRNANGPLSIEKNSVNERARYDSQICSPPDWRQERAGSTDPSAVLYGRWEIPNAFLLNPIKIIP